VWHDLFLSVSHVWHDSIFTWFSCVTWLIFMRVCMTCLYLTHFLVLHMSTSYIRVSHVTHISNTVKLTPPTNCLRLTREKRKNVTRTHDEVFTLQDTARHCKTLHRTAPHCTTLNNTAPHCNTLQHTTTHCNTHCNTRWSLHYPQTAHITYMKHIT